MTPEREAEIRAATMITFTARGGSYWQACTIESLALVDSLRAELAAAKVEFAAANNLLARIHRDGGHHTEQVGVVQSCADADAAWLRRELELDATRAELEAVKKERDNWMWAGMVHLRKGHNDTCSSQLSEGHPCDCGIALAEALCNATPPADEESGDG